MTYFDERTRTRDTAARLHGMLREVRAAPKDARAFLVFDKRDDWNDLGIGDDHVAAVDLTDDGVLDDHIAQAGAVARTLGHVDEDDTFSDAGDRDELIGGPGQDGLISVAQIGFQPGHGASNLADLRRQQNAFKASARDWSRGEDSGGFYGDVGLGVGPGFNLHVDRQGVTPSVGGGYFSTAKIGYADDLQALRDQRRNDRVFGDVHLGKKIGLGAEVRYRTVPSGLTIDRATGAVGPVEAGIDRDRGFFVDMPLELGAEAGFGVMKTLPTRPWKR